MPCNRWAGVVGGVFVCASWALRATDRMITVVIGPDDTDSIAPTPDSPRSRRRKWTGTALRARPGSTPYRPASWADNGGGGSSPYSSNYSGSSHAGSPSAGSPMLSYSPYSPMAPSPLSGRTPSSTGFSAPGSASGLGLPPNLFGQGPPPSSRTPATAATLGSPVPGLSTPPYSPFPPTPHSSHSRFTALPSLSDATKKDD
jgi:endoplasmic reticulum-Golgi intermediate compartment protein 2